MRNINRGTKIAVLGAGNVGATVAYTLAVDGMASEIALVDIRTDKAQGEALDIFQGTAFCPPTHIYSGGYDMAKDADIVVVTVGMPRKPGQSRIDLTQCNIDIIRAVIPEIVAQAPDAIYIIVSNPVDIITHAFCTLSGLPKGHVIGTGTLLDTSRLRAYIAKEFSISAADVGGFVLGEHGDTAVVPWSRITAGGLNVRNRYTLLSGEDTDEKRDAVLAAIEKKVRLAGAEIIGFKGATYYAISLAVRQLCECVVRDTGSVLAVSCDPEGEYGISDVSLSIPCLLGATGVLKRLAPPLTVNEKAALHHSADTLKEVIRSVNF
jgi:L-lactate dehydrogenase